MSDGDDILESTRDRVFPTAFSDALSERYLAYALSTITSRSLPDVRDGMKPVHRRILYAMRQMRLDPELGFKKSARVVGDVMGKFHPHGDAAIYDAMVRLAQEFAMRYRLVDGQGNFGNIDGDNPAAMRYTEARMTRVAQLLLDGIDEDTVDFRPTYDGESEEPCLLPAGFPNLLANGAQGIAVGMATSIPPHNVRELADAALYLIKTPNARVDTLLTFVHGPDFPTGGLNVEPAESIREAYATGRGGFRIRANWKEESAENPGEPRTKKSEKFLIVITEIPYQVGKSKLIERMAEMLQERKFPYLADIRDESADDVRIVLEPRTTRVEGKIIMESLFKVTDLEVRVPINLNVLDAEGRPGVMSLSDALKAWLAHRREVLVRRSRFRLGKIESRLEILKGYLVAYLNIDEVIAIIRTSDKPMETLMERFGLTQNQANAILDMRLRSLRKLEQVAIEQEENALVGEQKELEGLVGSEDAQWKRITQEVTALKEDFKHEERRTIRGEIPQDITVESFEVLVEHEPLTIICSKKGWVRALKGHYKLDTEVKYKEGDGPAFMFHAMSNDKIIIFGQNGRCYTVEAGELPSGRGDGEPVTLMINLPVDFGIVSMFKATDKNLIVAATSGHGFIVSGESLVVRQKKGRQVLRLTDGAKAAVCRIAEGDMVACVAENRKMVVFSVDDLPQMTSGKGVRMQRYPNNGQLSDVTVYHADKGLSWHQPGGRTRTHRDMSLWLGKRGAVGRLPPSGFPRPAKFT